MYSKRIYFNLLKTPVHLLYGCTFFSLCVLGACWWYCWYEPLVQHNRALENASTQLFAQTLLHKEQLKHAAAIQKKFSDFQIQFKKNKSIKDDALCALLDVAQKNGLSVTSAKLCRQKNKSWCAKHELQLESKGTLNQLIAFFEAMSAAKQLINCKNFQLTRADKDMLSVRATFAMYVIT